jgi:hypothetical protein
MREPKVAMVKAVLAKAVTRRRKTIERALSRLSPR